MLPTLLWNDWYAFTMAYPIWKHFRNYRVRYAFKNRSLAVRLTEFMDIRELRRDIDDIRAMRFTEKDIAWIWAQGVFPEGFMEFLEDFRMCEVEVDDHNGWLSIEYEDDWCTAIFWEAPLLALVMAHYMRGVIGASDQHSFAAAHKEGQRRLTSKFDIYKEHPDLPGFMEFGARRPFPDADSIYGWQEMCVRRALAEVPDKLLGTSNPYLAMTYGIPVSGTQAHQMEMVIAAACLAQGTILDPLAAAQKVTLDVWEMCYKDAHNGKYLTFLPDTFTTPFFLRHVEPERAARWGKWRQDSGDPFAKGDEIVAAIEGWGQDPAEHLLVPSNGLDINTMLALHYHFDGRIPHIYGWGGNFVNDTGYEVPSVVIKPITVSVAGAGTAKTVKLSDDMAKSNGTRDEVNRYKELIKA